jgi:hypothetical protein
MRAGLVDIVWFPLHVSGNHWTLLKINLITKTIAYSDSLGGTIPSEDLALIRWWLKCLLGDTGEFHVIAPDFPSPRQCDSHSCGIIVLSILAFVLLHYDLWCPEKAASERMQWFLRLSAPFADVEDLVRIFSSTLASSKLTRNLLYRLILTRTAREFLLHLSLCLMITCLVLLARPGLHLDHRALGLQMRYSQTCLSMGPRAWASKTSIYC